MASTLNPTDEAILALLTNPDRVVSGEEIRRGLGMTRAAIWKHVKRLREAGYTLEASPGSGYRLIASPNAPYACEVRKTLVADTLGGRIEFVEETDSTNLRLVAQAREGAPEGSILVADRQTAGRGRLARNWFSPPGVNLYFSLLLRPAVAPTLAPQLSLVAGLALCQAIETICPGLTPRVKWPNDIFLAGRKVSGILCDMAAEADRIHYLVVGVGVNVNLPAEALPMELADKATSLAIAIGREVSRPALLAAFLNHMQPLYQAWLASGLEPLLAALTDRAQQTGRRVVVETGRETLVGVARGFSVNGGLLLDCGGGPPREILCGDVQC